MPTLSGVLVHLSRLLDLLVATPVGGEAASRHHRPDMDARERAFNKRAHIRRGVSVRGSTIR